MRRVCYHGRWLKSCDDCISNGITCVFLTPMERVVCWHTGYVSECNATVCCRVIDVWVAIDEVSSHRVVASTNSYCCVTVSPLECPSLHYRLPIMRPVITASVRSSV